MLIAHKIELAPLPEQVDYFRRACGTNRFVWNWALAEWNRQYTAGLKPTALKLKKQFNRLKYASFPWLQDIHRDAHARPFANLARAWTRFFNQVKAGVAAHAPVFKRRGQCQDSFYVANDKLTLKERRVRLPVIGWIWVKESLRFGGRVMGASVQRHAERWYLSVQVEVDVSWLVAKDRTEVTGVDLNIYGIVCSNGKTYETPLPLHKAVRRLKIRQRRLSRKVEAAKRVAKPEMVKGKDGVDRPRKSNNRIKAAAKIGRLHYRIGCIRKDFLHKVTSELTRENQAVAIEGLAVKNMTASASGTALEPGRQVKQKIGLNRAILDVGFGEFRRQMTYKSERYGTELIIADRWFASSKLCSGCNTKNEELTLKDRCWRCTNCGVEHDRDVNASINLKRLATGMRTTALPGATGKVTSVRYEHGQQDGSGQKPPDREGGNCA